MFVNAGIDALSHLGVRHLDTPLTPERVWRAIRDASAVLAPVPPPLRKPPPLFETLPRTRGTDVAESHEADL